jgi:hypothetical protein
MTSESLSQPVTSQVPSGRTIGIMIASASLLSVCFMAYHPTIHSHQADAFIAEINNVALVNRIVHGFLIALTGLLACGFSGMASRLGLGSGMVRAGLAAYIMGALAMVAAAAINGFMLPDFVARYEGRPKESLEIMSHILAYSGVANRVCSQMGVLAMSIAVLLWSISLVGRPGALRAAGLFGCVTGMVLVVALLLGYLKMDVHGMLAFVLCQTMWSLSVAALLIRGRI